jgi:hypothetical protein
MADLIVGVVTELGRSADDELEETFRKLIPYWGTPDEGSSTTMVAATDPALNGEQLDLLGYNKEGQTDVPFQTSRDCT